MKKLALLLSIIAMNSIHAEEGFCTTCNKVNKYNKENQTKYKYYEDYLEAVNSGEEKPKDPQHLLNQIRRDY